MFYEVIFWSILFLVALAWAMSPIDFANGFRRVTAWIGDVLDRIAHWLN